MAQCPPCMGYGKTMVFGGGRATQVTCAACNGTGKRETKEDIVMEIKITADKDLQFSAGVAVRVAVNGREALYRVAEERVERHPHRLTATYTLTLLREDPQPVHPGGTREELQDRLEAARAEYRALKARIDGKVVGLRGSLEDTFGALLDVVELLAKERT